MSDGFRSARLLNPTDHRVSPEFFDSLLGDCADAAAQLRQKPVRKADLYVVAKPFTALSLWQKTLRVFGRETAAYAVQPAWHVVTSAERLGKETSYVPIPELESSTWPEPCSSVPFHAVRALRVGIASSRGMG